MSHKYLVEDKWYKPYAGGPKTPVVRVIPVQESLGEMKTSILPYDDVEKILDSARVIGLAKCACKMRNEILGIRKCKGKYPLESCMPLNQGAVAWIERGLAREITKEEAKKLCKEFNSIGLVHSIENFGDGTHQLLCNCCSCCCNPLSGITQWDNPRGVASANYFAFIESPENCTGCETCVEICPFEAISMINDKPHITKEKCLGCGSCVVNCPLNIIKLNPEQREQVFDSLMEMVSEVIKEKKALETK